jgi:hypothetical protein
VSLGTDANPGATHDVSGWVFRAGLGAVIQHRVVDDLAAVHAGEADAPTGAGHDNVVRHREVRPISIEGVDPLQIGWEWQLRIGLSDDPVAVDNDVAGYARISLHAIHVRAVPEHLVVVNVILCDQYIARDVVDPIVAKSVDLVAGEQHIVGSVATILAHDARGAVGELSPPDRSCGAVEQVGDDDGLAPDIMTVNLSKLSLPHHRHRFETRQSSPRGMETAEAEPRPDKALDTPVVLLDDVVEVFALPQTGAGR